MTVKEMKEATLDKSSIMRTAAPFTIRRLCESDCESLYSEVRNSIAELSYWMPWCHANYTMEDAGAWIRFADAAWLSGSEYPFGIVELATDRVIGGTGIHDINKHNRMGAIGYWVSSRYKGPGIAVTATRLVADFGFNTLGLARLEIVALTHNIASQRVAELAGARRESYARNRLMFEGKPHDAIVFALLPE